MSSVAFGVLTLALLIPSVVLREVAHGLVSLRFGDPTARDAGRLSLNPLGHVDLFGTVLLPLPLWSAGDCDDMIAEMIEAWLSPLKARRPVSIS